MMKHLIEGYRHYPGRHCGSTALSNWFRYYGHDIDEAMAFGLGAGLGFAYVEVPQLSPSHMVMTRAAQLETQAWDHLGIPNTVKIGTDPWAVWETNKRMIDTGIPIVISCDLAYLPYWKTKTHFNGHRISLVGYDDGTKTAYISDTHYEGFQTVTYDELIAARTSSGPPLMSSDSFYHDPDVKAKARPLAKAIPPALNRQADEMLNANMGERGGVQGLALMAERLPTWAEAPDRKWCHRFSYQVIEKRGTGGAGFRTLYSEFLEQAEKIVPKVKSLGLAPAMREIETDWKAMAAEFHRHSELETAGPVDTLAALANALARKERAWAERVLGAGF